MRHLGGQHLLALEREPQMEDAVHARVLRSHVHQGPLGVQNRIARKGQLLGHRRERERDGVRGVAVLRLECGTVVTVAREAPREVLGVHAARRHDEVLAQRMTLEVVAKHDAAKVRASLEDDAEQVVDLALERQGARPQRDDRGHAEGLLGQFDREHDRRVVGAPRDGVDHLDARSLGRSLGGGQTARGA